MRAILFPLFLGVVVLTGAAVLIVWLRAGVSDQELLANFSKAGDFWRGIESERGWPWWSPHFLQGTSLAFSWGTMVTNALLLIFALPLGALVGSKVAMVVAWGTGGVGMFCFLRRWAALDRAAWSGAVIFLCFAPVLTRALDVEHLVVVVSMAVLPWVLWSVVGLIRNGTKESALCAGAWTSALLLAYGKTAVMAFPALLVFVLVEYFHQPRGARPPWRILGIFAGVVLALGVVPNLPALRETGFVAMFEFGPFEGWQRALSTKSALSWFDRGGMLGAGMEDGFASSTTNGGTYVGLVCGAVLAIALMRRAFDLTETGRRARLMFVLGLGMYWLSFGPRSVFGGHFEFLRLSAGAADFTPAIAWFLLGVQGWIIFRLVPEAWPYSRWIAGIASLIYLFLPGFLLLECLPLYGNIRAPFDFYQVTGSVCMVAAVALSLEALLQGSRSVWIRRVGAVVMLLCVVIDHGVYAVPMLSGGLPREVWKDFNSAQEFLESAPESGRVFPFSGRYFYLMTPWMSGRSLSTEAFNNYLQQRGAAILQATAFLDNTNLETFMRISGVAYVLVDKSDPDTSKSMQERLKKLFPVAFENTSFAVLAVEESLGAGFLVRDLVQAKDSSPENALAALGGASHNLAMIELANAPAEMPGLQGQVSAGRIIPLEARPMEEGRQFLPVSGGMKSYQSARFGASDVAGWLVFNEAWHPDWRAYEEGMSIPVKRAMLAFSAVETNGSAPVEFRFEPPWWYDWCAWGGVLGWGGVLLLCGVGTLRSRRE
jgi:hypothetical protein